MSTSLSVDGDPIGPRPVRVLRTVTVREELARFAEAMEATLVRNDHKKHWRTVPAGYCFDRLQEEVVELETAMRSPAPRDEVQREATDVANFAMFIWDILQERAQSTKTAIEAPAADPINPPHYQRAGLEAFDVIDAFELTYHVGTAVAYLLRAGKKTADPREDIEKAVRHLQRELERLGKR